MTIAEPRTRRWSREEYYRMADLGWFGEQRVELIEGEIIEMPPQNNMHSVAIEMVERALEAAFGSKAWVRTQLPLNVPDGSAPEPDLAVVWGNPRDFQDHPQSALLVVEISDWTLRYDRTRKGPLYAQSGIAEYWIVNLIDRKLEVHRNPQVEAGGKSSRYTDVQPLLPSESISPLSMPAAVIQVADLFP